jgi:hemolysin III
MYYGERFNGISHLIGAAAALAGTLVLIIMASLQGDPWKIVSFSIYGASLVALYTFSTLYHSLRGEAKALFRKLDHNAIYLLIAGTYTPFVMVTLRDRLGWTIFVVVWVLAIVGMVYDSLPQKRARIIPVIIYLVMGWLALFLIDPLVNTLPTAAIVGLVTGGLFYTVGVVFYALNKVRHFHGIWHLFVLAGSVSHYITILKFVA